MRMDADRHEALGGPFTRWQRRFERIGFRKLLFGPAREQRAGLVFTPALLLVIPPNPNPEQAETGSLIARKLGTRMLRHSGKVVCAAVLLLAVGGAGIMWMQSKIDPMDFFPKGAQVVIAEVDLLSRDGRFDGGSEPEEAARHVAEPPDFLSIQR